MLNKLVNNFELKTLIKNMGKELYSEEEIVTVDEHLKNLKGKILQSNEGEFFKLKNYKIKGVSLYPFNWFKERKEVRMFYIESITIDSSEGTYYHENDIVCTMDGIKIFIESQERFNDLEKRLITFSLKTNSDDLRFLIKNIEEN